MPAMDPEQREAMRESFARLLADSCSEAELRRIIASSDAHDPHLWSKLARNGLLTVLVPEEYGGIGGGAREIEILMEEAGKALLPGPFFSSAVLATAALVESSDEEAKARLLPALAHGSLIGTVAITGDSGLWDGDDGDVTSTGDGDTAKLSGAANYVSDGAVADLLLVIAGRGAGRKLFEVNDRAGLSVTGLDGFDITQRLARIDFADVAAREIAGGGAAAIDRALAVARIALAGRQAGAAQRNFAFTVEYLRRRIQFGRPIGGFQAVKHMAADLLIESESAVSGARAAAEAYASRTAQAEELIAMASFAVSEAQVKIAFDGLQLHGGIGFTWDHPCHLYLRRAWHDSKFLGSNELARDRFIAILEKQA